MQKRNSIAQSKMPNITASQVFLSENPAIKKCIEEQATKGDLPAEFTPTVVEIKYEGLTYIRYESGEITASRECGRGYNPPFWEVWFDEHELGLFVLGAGEVLIDRTAQITELDQILEDCDLLKPES